MWYWNTISVTISTLFCNAPKPKLCDWLNSAWQCSGSVNLINGSGYMRRGSVMVRRGSVMVRRGSVGSALACCKPGPSSILGSAPQGGVSHWAYMRWGNGERPQRMVMDKCIMWLWMLKKSMKNKQKEWHHATKPLITYPEAEPLSFSFLIWKVDIFLKFLLLFNKTVGTVPGNDPEPDHGNSELLIRIRGPIKYRSGGSGSRTLVSGHGAHFMSGKS